jgi:hypothetical protein
VMTFKQSNFHTKDSLSFIIKVITLIVFHYIGVWSSRYCKVINMITLISEVLPKLCGGIFINFVCIP